MNKCNKISNDKYIPIESLSELDEEKLVNTILIK